MTQHTFTISAATHLGVDDWLKHTVEMIKKTDANEVYHFENIQYQKAKAKQEYITNISETEKKYLIENEYITEIDAQYINVREIYDQEFSKFVRQLPRGNDEAEARFRKQMGSK